jgi:uncharacterized integral membrane protein
VFWPNETKISDGYRERVPIEVQCFNHGKVNAQRVAVRCIVWLGPAVNIRNQISNNRGVSVWTAVFIMVVYF